MSARLEDRFARILAEEIGARVAQVQAAAELLAEGSTVPFIARYRKEVNWPSNNPSTIRAFTV